MFLYCIYICINKGMGVMEEEKNINWDKVNVMEPQDKEQISIRLDRDIVEFFKADGLGYQAKINGVLKSYTVYKKEQMKQKGIVIDKYKINGSKALSGEITVSGSKNSVLAMMAASILVDGDVYLKNVPNLRDVDTMILLLEKLGAEVKHYPHKHELIINTENVNDTCAPYDIVRKMRATYYVLAPLVSRFKQAQVSLPGGCVIGARPMDLHITALKKLGCDIELKDGYIHASVKKNIHGGEIELINQNYSDWKKKYGFLMRSNGATIQTLLASVKGKGKTIIKNASLSPEVDDLINMLNKMGAKIERDKKEDRTIYVEGVSKLKGCEYEVIGDRIEAGTYACAAAITKSKVKISKINPDYLTAFLDKLEEMGVPVDRRDDFFVVDARNATLKAVDVNVLSYPEFPTDLQAQFMTVLTQAKGISKITENIWENRFMHVPELRRMGADIRVENSNAYITGNTELKGTSVMSSDLRASSSLVLAGLVAKGETEVLRIYHLDRGFERFEDKLQSVGADIKRIK